MTKLSSKNSKNSALRFYKGGTGVNCSLCDVEVKVGDIIISSKGKGKVICSSCGRKLLKAQKGRIENE